jgi:hypothetical protein
MQGAGLPDGGIVTTPSDMVTFFRGLLVDGTLLKPATLKEMLTPRLDTGDSVSIGYHIFMQGDAQNRVYWHDGYIDGYQAWLSHGMGTNITIAVWANGTGKKQDQAFSTLTDAVLAVVSGTQ